LTADRTRRKAIQGLESWQDEARQYEDEATREKATKAIDAALTEVRATNEGGILVGVR
jgi:hypothetical protein